MRASIYPPIHISIYPSIHPCIYLFIHPSIHPSITGQWMPSSAVCTNSLQNSLPECQAGCQYFCFSLHYFSTINILYFLTSVLGFPAKSCLVFQEINEPVILLPVGWFFFFGNFIAPLGQESVEWTQTTLTLEHLPLWKYESHWEGRHIFP